VDVDDRFLLDTCFNLYVFGLSVWNLESMGKIEANQSRFSLDVNHEFTSDLVQHQSKDALSYH